MDMRMPEMDGLEATKEIRLTYPGGRIYTISTSLLDYKGLEKMTLIGTKAKTKLRFYHMANNVKLCRKHGRNQNL